MLAVNYPEVAFQNLWQVLLRWTSFKPFGHHADGLPIPLDVVHEIVNLPINPPTFSRSDHPLVRGFFTFEAVYIEREVASHGPAVFGVVVEVVEDFCGPLSVRVLPFL